MKISKDSVVTIDYTLKDNSGAVLDTSADREPLSYIQGAGAIIPGLENALEGKQKGESLSVTLASKDAYGDYDESLIVTVPKDKLQVDAEIKVGMQFQTQTQYGPRILIVKAIEGNDIKLDGNHPLAGQELNFDVFIKEVREATKEELEHGHVH